MKTKPKTAIPPRTISKFPLPDYDAGVCEAGPSIGYIRELSPVEICTAFAANPKAMHIEMPGGWQVRSAVEGNGLWRICRNVVRGKGRDSYISRGRIVSRHATFAEARAALGDLVRTTKRNGQWSIYCGTDEEPWESAGIVDSMNVQMTDRDGETP
jgi:hypothetical protein